VLRNTQVYAGSTTGGGLILQDELLPLLGGELKRLDRRCLSRLAIRSLDAQGARHVFG
jgi:hypothetical protein